METSIHQLLSGWDNFYVIAGSSAGALTGLQFVVMALVADTPGLGDAESVDAFGTPTVFHFCMCLFVSAMLAAPWTALTPVVWVLGVSGGWGVVYTLIVLRRSLRQTLYHPVLEDWIWHAALPLVAYSGLVGAVVAMHTAPVQALFLVAAAALMLIFIGIHNAWDTVAYIAVQHREMNADREAKAPHRASTRRRR